MKPATDSPLPTKPLPAEIKQLVSEFADIFESLTELPPRHLGDHVIPLVQGAQPFKLRPYRYNPAQKTEIEQQITELLQKGLIQPSTSLYSSPALLVKKKIGDWRLCVDYRKLNAFTVKNKFPLPIIDEILDELSRGSWFTSFRIDYATYLCSEMDDRAPELLASSLPVSAC